MQTPNWHQWMGTGGFLRWGDAPADEELAALEALRRLEGLAAMATEL